MEPITIVAGIAVAASVATALKIYFNIKKKNDEINALRHSLTVYAQTYSFEKADERLVNACQEVIKRFFPEGIENEFSKLKTIEERKRLASDVLNELAKAMQLRVDVVEFQDLGLYTRGLAMPDTNQTVVFLNESLLVADPVQLVKTMCHELKHCVQYHSFRNNVWGYSASRVAQYLYSWDNYVSCDSIESYEAYLLQIIEIDANKFADEIFNK